MTVLTTEGAVFHVDTERVACYGDVTFRWHTDGSAFAYHHQEAVFCLDKEEMGGQSYFLMRLLKPYDGKTGLSDATDQVHLELMAMIRFKSLAGEALVKW